MLAATEISFEYPLAPGVAPNKLLKPFDELQPPQITLTQIGDDQKLGRAVARSWPALAGRGAPLFTGPRPLHARPSAPAHRTVGRLRRCRRCWCFCRSSIPCSRRRKCLSRAAAHLIFRPLVGLLLLNTLTLTVTATAGRRHPRNGCRLVRGANPLAGP